MSYDILGMGCVAVDEVLVVDEFPAEDAKLPVAEHLTVVGGTTATALRAAAKLGIQCGYCGTLGEDPSSRVVVDTFTAEGIDTSLIRLRGESRPIRCTVIVSQKSGSRTVLYDLAGAVPADAQWPPEGAIRAAKLLLVDQFGTEGMVRAVEIAKRANIPVVADLEHFDERSAFLDLVANADHWLVTRELARKLTRQSHPAAAIEQLWTGAHRAILVTCGAEGVWFRASDADSQVRHCPAFAVLARDTTGCGDVFRGAYAVALLGGSSVAECIRFASAAAALRAEASSPSERLPSREAVQQLIATRPAMP